MHAAQMIPGFGQVPQPPIVCDTVPQLAQVSGFGTGGNGHPAGAHPISLGVTCHEHETPTG